ncbi:MAG: InlB B-repeat-containing protein [Christensenellaceae bacterium]|nr:InlB B-repeat-containing protein [Christensenellaceae bacterium]
MKDNKILSIALYVIIALACVAIVLSCIALFAGKKLTSNDNTTGNGTETKTYSISFDSESGSEVQSIVSESGKPINEPIPEKEGMIFDGWYTSNDGGVTLSEKFDFGYMPESDVQLYAKWKEPTVKRNIYAYSSVMMIWVGNEKETILSGTGKTEEEIEEEGKSILPAYASIWFDAYTEGVAVLGGFYADETDPYTAWYKIDSERVIHFYANEADMIAGENEKYTDLFGCTFTVSADCKKIEMVLRNDGPYQSHYVFVFDIVQADIKQ